MTFTIGFGRGSDYILTPALSSNSGKPEARLYLEDEESPSLSDRKGIS